MISLKVRSYKKELLDSDNIPFEDIKKNMKELNTVNKLLGGHKISIQGIQEIIGKTPSGRQLSVCEIGCGGGDNLKAISKWFDKKLIKSSFTGIDIKTSCTDFAARKYPELSAKWITSDYKKVLLDNDQPDIIFSSLFCHHFKDEELVTMMNWMQMNSGKGFFINDLHRNLLAYYLIRLITRIFSKSYLVKNDAPLSVARGFKKSEWQNILRIAGIHNYSIKWKWAFRYLIVCKNGPGKFV